MSESSCTYTRRCQHIYEQHSPYCCAATTIEEFFLLYRNSDEFHYIILLRKEITAKFIKQCFYEDIPQLWICALKCIFMLPHSFCLNSSLMIISSRFKREIYRIHIEQISWISRISLIHEIREGAWKWYITGSFSSIRNYCNQILNVKWYQRMNIDLCLRQQNH